MAVRFFLATAVVAVAVVSGAPVGVGDGAGVRLEHEQRSLQQGGPGSSMLQPDGTAVGLDIRVHEDPSFAAPEQVHIALGRSDSPEEYAVTVAWVTWPNTQSRVVWGSSVDNLGNIADGSSTSESKPLLYNSAVCN